MRCDSRRGFPLRLFEERTGLPLAAALPGLDAAEARGFIVRDHERAAPTALGRRFLNDALADLPAAVALGRYSTTPFSRSFARSASMRSRLTPKS